MTHHVAARYDDSEGLFLPPLRTLGFNPQLQLNDHLLAQSYIEAYDISYPDALHRIENEVAELQQHLNTSGSYELNDIGTLSVNDEGNLEFEPCEAGILTPALYGLSTFEMPYIDEAMNIAAQQKKTEQVARKTSTKDKAKKSESTHRQQDDAIIVKMSWVRNAIVAAAAVIAFFLMSQPVANDDLMPSVQQSSMLPISVKSLAPAPYEAPVAEQEAVASPAEQEATPNKEEASPAYVIVLASQTSARNAEDFIGRLEKGGYHQARTMAMSTSKYVRVVYGSYKDEADAHQHLRKLRAANEAFNEAWVLKVSE